MNTLPIELAGSLTQIEALADEQARNRPKVERKPVTGTRAEVYTAAAFDKALSELAATPQGERNNVILKTAINLYSMALGNWPGIDISTVERGIEGVVSAWPNREKSLQTMHNGRKYATPRPLELPEREKKSRRKQAPRPAPSAPSLDADLMLNQQYIELPPNIRQRCIAIQSDVGTGKTKTAIREAGAETGKVLYLSHREKLAGNFSEDATRAGVPVEHYKEMLRKDWRRVPKLALCINSYMTMATDGKGLPRADLLIIDEFDQLLNHVYGDAGTFRGNEAILAAEALRYAIQTAGRVIVMDAHLSETALKFLKDLRGDDDVFTVVNDHVAERGTLTLYEKQSGANAAGMRLVEANEGVIAFACASVKRAQVVAADLVRLLGNADAVLLVTAENADGERQRAFLQNPNGEMGNYRAVVYSPVIGTGFDITAPVRAVVAIMGQHLSAYDARQMVGRCRAARELHVWLPNTGSDLEENASAIYALELEKAERTGLKLTADGHAVPDMPENQQRYLEIHAQVMARHNASVNRLRAHFEALSRGYRIIRNEDTDKVLYERQKAMSKALEAARKERVLVVPPVDRDTHDRLERAGRLDPDTADGYLRWKIETTSGLEITPELRDCLWTSHARRALVGFADLLDDFNELELSDLKEATENVPLPARRHRMAKRAVRNDILNVLVDTQGRAIQFSKDDLETALTPVIAKHEKDLRLYFNWRPDRCQSAAATTRRILKGIGLRLESEQATVNGKKVRYYRVSADDLRVLMRLAAARLKMLRASRMEAQTSNLKNASEAYSDNGGFKIVPPPETDRASTMRLIARLAAGKVVNPFSKEHELCRA